jgi:GT2 family glycosyltransferase
MNDMLRHDEKALNAASVVFSPLAVDVSVVMVVFMTGPALFESISFVLSEQRVGEFVIVDNGSPEEDEARLKQLAEAEPRVKLLTGHGNVGFARGCNMGAAAATGRRLLFLNPDAYLQPGCVAALEDAHRTSKRRPCLIGAHVMNADGTEQRGGRRGEVTPVTALLSFTRLAERVPFLRGFEIHREVTDPLPQQPIEVPTISGACFFMAREDFAALEGFDDGFFLHVEDVDLCWRVRRKGGVVLFHPQARVIHLGSTSQKHPLFIEYWKGLGLSALLPQAGGQPVPEAAGLCGRPGGVRRFPEPPGHARRAQAAEDAAFALGNPPALSRADGTFFPSFPSIQAAAESSRSRSRPGLVAGALEHVDQVSVAMLPVALGAKGQPPMPPQLASSTVTPAWTPAKALARPVFRVSWKCSRSVASGAALRAASTRRVTVQGSATPMVSARAISPTLAAAHSETRAATWASGTSPS